MYKNYVFDLYGTLLDIRTNENKPYLWKKMSEIYSALGADYTAGELKRTFRALEQELVSALPENGEPNLRLVFGELLRGKGVRGTSLSPGETINSAVSEIGNRPDANLVTGLAITFRALSRNKLCVYDGVRETLQYLKANGKGVYLLSNAQTDFTRPEIAMTGLVPYFDGILISSEVGCKKPAKEFYDCLFQRFQLKPEECLMVGNDEGSDIAGAMQVGMDSLYIHTEISPEMTGESKATYAVMDGDWSKVGELLRRH